MPTYYKNTGSTGTMKIVDTGTTVEFWLEASSATFDYEMPWRYYVNGAWSSYRNYSFTGGAYRKLGHVTVTTDQTVGFGIGATGTSGLGGPTDFTVSVDRTSAPPAPGAWIIENITNTTVQGDTDSYGTGGLPIDAFQVRYDDSSTAASPSYYTPGDTGYGTVTGLTPGGTYYFWIRSHNAKGWSPWSARTSAKMHNIPSAPSVPVVTAGPTQSSVTTKFSGNSSNGGTTVEHQLNYGTNPTTPENTVTSNSGLTVTANLVAGQKYYFRARSRNQYGWSAYSGLLTVQLKAGAYVKMGDVWKRAVPYVNVNGVWKVAQPYAKIAGLWKETS